MLRRNLRLKTIAIVTVALVIIVAGALVGVVRLVDIATPRYRADLAERLSERIEQPLHIGAMDMAWSWTGPILELSDVTLLDHEGGEPVARLDGLALRFSFWHLVRGELQPVGIVLTGPRVSAYRGDDGSLHLQGVGSGGSGTFDSSEAAQWIDRLDFLRITDGELTWTGETELPENLRLTGVTLSLSNQGPRHRLEAQAMLPEAIGDELSLDVFILGDPGQPTQIQAHGYLHATGLVGAKLLQAAGIADHRLHGGRSNLEIWSDWRAGAFAGARLSLDAGSLRLDTDNGQKTLNTAVTAAASVAAEQDGYRFTLDRIAGSTAGGSLDASFDTGRYKGVFQDLPAPLVLGYLKLAAPQRLAAWRVQGSLPRLELRYARGQEETSYHVAGSFNNLALTEPKDDIALGKIDGAFTLAPAGGTLRLSGADGALQWPPYLRGSLPLKTLEGSLDWQRADDGWRIQATGLNWAGAGAQLSGGGKLQITNAHAAQADLDFQASAKDVTALLPLIPQADELPNPRLRDWLPDALRAGRLESAQIHVHGPLDRFPFEQGAGEFRVQARLTDITLAYKPGWPRLTGGNGSLTLVGDTLAVDAQSGSILGVGLEPATARIANVREPVLKVDGGADNAQAKNLLAFLPASPLADKFGRLAKVLDVDGPADLGLKLSIPLKPELGEVAVDGRLQLDGVGLKHAALPYPIQGITGLVRFDRGGLYAEDLAGNMAGLPLTADLGPGSDGALKIETTAQVQLPRNEQVLRTFVPDAIVSRASGKTSWQTRLSVTPNGRVSDMLLQSDLDGMALDMPAPLGKPADTKTPIKVSVSADRSHVHVDLAQRLDMKLHAVDGRLQSANLMFGGGKAEPADEPGLWLGGELERADLDAWREFTDGLGGREGGSGLALRGADLQIGQLRFRHLQLAKLHLRATPLIADNGWQLDIDGDGAAGSLRWQTDAGERGAVSAHLSHIDLSTSAPPPEANATADSGATQPLDPGTFPALDLSSAKTRIDGTDFGSWRIHADTLPAGIALERLDIKGGALEANGTGQWTRVADQTQAAFKGQLQGSSVDKLLQAAGYTPNIRAQDTRVQADLKVAPNPQGLDPATLDGNLSLQLKKGNLLMLEPGAGRVLGLLNFYTLPRRLMFDFRDVLNKGMAFDEIKGDFQIDSGSAKTDNLNIDTPSAKIRIDGRIGLAAQTYDERVTIVPQVSSGVAIAGTVLGGPAVGAALLVAQKLLEKPIKNLSSVTYHLTGSWGEPEIEKVNRQE